MKTESISKFVLAVGVGLIGSISVGQDCMIQLEGTEFSSVDAYRELPAEVNLRPELDITRTNIIDVSQPVDDLDQWTDDLSVERSTDHLRVCHGIAMGRSPLAIESGGNEQRFEDRHSSAKLLSDIRRELTKGMWSWTFRERFCRLRFRGISGFVVADNSAVVECDVDEEYIEVNFVDSIRLDESGFPSSW